MPQGVVASDGAVGVFNSILRASYARIFATFDDNTLATNGRRKEAMKQIEAIAEQTGVDLSAWVNVEVRAFYEKGMFDTMKGIFDEGAPVRIDKAFAHFHEEAIKALADAGISDIAKAMQGISSSGQQIISNAARQAVLEQVATGQLLGETRKKIKDNVVEALKKNGVSALVDRGGNTWELSRYGSMLARTKMTQAHNSGAINRMAESGYDLVQVSDHFGECELCRPWEGQILSVTGQTKGYDSLGKAEAAGLFHPNCRHTITPAHAEYLNGSLVWDAEKGEYVPYGQQGKQDAAGAPAMKQDAIKKQVDIVKSAIDEAEKELARFNVEAKGKQEKFIALDSSGKRVFEITGTANKVGIPLSDIAKVKDTVMTHNHPNEPTLNVGASLSLQDLMVASKYDAKEIRAVSSEAIYSMVRPDNGWFGGYIETLNPALKQRFSVDDGVAYLLRQNDRVRNSEDFLSAKKAAQEKFVALKNSGAEKKTLSIKSHELNVDLHNLQIKLLSERMAWEYNVYKKI